MAQSQFALGMATFIDVPGLLAHISSVVRTHARGTRVPLEADKKTSVSDALQAVRIFCTHRSATSLTRSSLRATPPQIIRVVNSLHLPAIDTDALGCADSAADSDGYEPYDVDALIGDQTPPPAMEVLGHTDRHMHKNDDSSDEEDDDEEEEDDVIDGAHLDGAEDDDDDDDDDEDNEDDAITQPALLFQDEHFSSRLSSRLSRSALVSVLSHLGPLDRARCARVSRDWNVAAMDPSLWTEIDLSHLGKRLTSQNLENLGPMRLGVCEYLSLAECVNVTNASLQLIAQQSPNLLSVNLAHCYQITDAGVMFLAQYCKNLQVVNLVDNPNVTIASVSALAANCKNLKELHLDQCGNLDVDDCFRISEAVVLPLFFEDDDDDARPGSSFFTSQDNYEPDHVQTMGLSLENKEYLQQPYGSASAFGPLGTPASGPPPGIAARPPLDLDLIFGVNTAAAAAAASAAGGQQPAAAWGAIQPPANFTPQAAPRADHVLDIVDKVVKLSRSQYGCRLLQAKLELADKKKEDRRHDGSSIVVAVVFEELRDGGVLLDAMTDPFAHYLMQRLIERLDEVQRLELIDLSAQRLAAVASDAHGTRVVQRLISNVETEHERSLVCDALRASVRKLIFDSNASHCIIAVLERFSSREADWIYQAVMSASIQVSNSKHGCRVVQRAVEYADNPATKLALIEELTRRASVLVANEFGNFVVQALLKLQIDHISQAVASQLIDNVQMLACGKYSSPVLEKVLNICDPRLRAVFLREITASIHVLVHDRFANYVVQTAIAISDPRQRSDIIQAILPELPALAGNNRSRRLVERVLKELKTSSDPNHMAVVKATTPILEVMAHNASSARSGGPHDGGNRRRGGAR